MINSISDFPKYKWVKDWDIKPHMPKLNHPHLHPIKAKLDNFGKILIHDIEQIYLQFGLQFSYEVIHLCDCLIICSQNKKSSIELIILDSGILYGQIEGIDHPSLIGKQVYKINENLSKINIQNKQINYHISNNHFCCFITDLNYKNTNEIIENVYKEDFNLLLENRFHYRKNKIPYLNQSESHNTLLLLCLEKMLSSLRSPVNEIPGLWAISDDNDESILDINTLIIQIFAWISIDADIAMQLLNTLLKLQTSSGSIPCQINIDSEILSTNAPTPVLCMLTEHLYTKKTAILNESILIRLIRYLRWCNSYYDPVHKEIHLWRSKQEIINPSIDDTDLITSDLTSLLLNEIKCLENLIKLNDKNDKLPDDLVKMKKNLENNLNGLFWNEDNQDYSNAYLRDKKVIIENYNSLLPMLCGGYQQSSRTNFLERLKHGELIDKSNNLSTWREINLQDKNLPILQKILFIKSIRKFDPAGTIIYDYVRLAMNGFIDWFNCLNEINNTFKINQKNAAHVIDINQEYRRNYQISNKRIDNIIRKLKLARIDRIDFAIVGTTILLIAGIKFTYSLNKEPPPYSTIETEMISSLGHGDIKHLYKSANLIIKNYPEHDSLAHLYLANSYLKGGNLDSALYHINCVREKYPDSPGPMFINAITLHLLKKNTEADKIYYEFIYLFDLIFPEIVKKASLYKFLIKENLELPDNWIDIYDSKFTYEI